MPKGVYNKLVLEFDLCELSIAQFIHKRLSRTTWDEVARMKKIEYLEIARGVLNVTDEYYELIPTFWKE